MVDFQTYLDIIHPSRFKQTIEREAKKRDLRAALINMLILSLLAVFSSMIVYSVLPRPTLPPSGAPSFLQRIVTFNPVASPLGMLVSLVWGVVFYYLVIVIQHAIAALLGGKGNRENLLYCSSIAAVSLTVLLLPFQLASAIPAIACVAAIPSLVLGIYGIYIQYKILRAVYPALSRERAVAVYILYILAVMLLSTLYLLVRIALGI